MKRMVRHSMILAWVAVSCIAGSGCKKDSTATSNAKLLTSAPWKQTKDEWQQTVSGAWVDQVAAGKAVLSTAVLTFFDNNTWSINGGAYGTWQLSGNDTQLTMLGSTGTSVTVATINSTTLQLTGPQTNEYTVTMNPYVITYYSTERDSYSH